VTLDRPDLSRHLSIIHKPRKVPVILSPDEVARFLEAAPGIKYKAAFSVAYGAGLRVSEVASLKVSDIDSKRMMLRIEQGKGHKDRYAMLSPTLLELLRDWYRVARPQGWLFPGQNPCEWLSGCASKRWKDAGDASRLPGLRRPGYEAGASALINSLV
jgi:integrase/recombinase XerD